MKGIGCDIQVNSCNTTDALYGQGNTYVELTGGEIRVCGEAKEQGPAYFIPEPLYPKKNNPANVVPDPYMDIFNPPGSEFLERFDDVSAPNDGDCTYTNYVSTDSAVELWPRELTAAVQQISIFRPLREAICPDLSSSVTGKTWHRASMLCGGHRWADITVKFIFPRQKC